MIAFLMSALQTPRLTSLHTHHKSFEYFLQTFEKLLQNFEKLLHILKHFSSTKWGTNSGSQLVVYF